MGLVDKLKSVGKKAGLGLATLVATVGLTGKADAGMISIRNYTADSGIGTTTEYFKNIDDATEGYDTYDLDFMNPLQTNALLINSNVDGHVVGVNSKEINTLGFAFDLGIQGSVTNISNLLRYRVTDSTDLTNPALLLGGNEYFLIMDNAWHSINLPNVTGTNTTYASGYLQLREQSQNPPVAEPIGLGAAGIALLAMRKRRD